MTLRGVLLDIDGTLLDSNDAHAKAYELALAERGLQVSFARIRPLIGMGGDKLLSAVGVSPESPVGERVGNRKKELFAAQFLPGLRPFPGARDLLDRMKSRGLSLVVATSAEGDELGMLLRQAGIEGLMDGQSTSSDANASKPDPDIVEAAIARSKHARDELIMLGDTPYDVAAATRAGVRIVTVRSGGWMDGDLAGSLATYEDVGAILAGYDASPFAGT